MADARVLTAEELLGCTKPVVERMELEGLLPGGERAAVYVRGITVEEGDRLKSDKHGEMAMTLFLGLVNENGDRIFGEDQIESLGRLPLAPALKAVQRIQWLSGLDVDIEETAKNSDGSPST